MADNIILFCKNANTYKLEIIVNKHNIYIDFVYKISIIKLSYLLTSIQLLIMMDKEKKHDFWKTTNLPESKKIINETNIKAWSILGPEKEKFLIKFVIDVIQALNPDTEILHKENIIFCDVPEKLKLPEWFYFSDINWITNKNIKESWIFVSITVYPLRYHPSNNWK